MTARKPRFERRVGYALHDPHTVDGKGQWAAGPHRPSLKWTKVVVSDARDLTPQQAVQKVLQAYEDECGNYHSAVQPITARMAGAAGMLVSKKNCEVSVRRRKS